MTRLETVRLDQSFERWHELLNLILASFAYMDGRIAPPSSALELTPQSLQEKAEREIGYVVSEGNALLGCIFCRPEPECLYIGKLAVLPAEQGTGIGGMLLGLAEETARRLNLSVLRLETRVELTGNHAAFARWGFVKTAENAHPGFGKTTSIEMQKTLPAL
jgi:predicted N-acetyltransferase YhbS